jgi:hypothetical protein
MDATFLEELENQHQEFIRQLEAQGRALAVAHFHGVHGWDNITAKSEFQDIMNQLRDERGH